MDKVVSFSMLKKGNNTRNICTCGAMQRIIIDPDNYTVYCETCGNYVEPFKALLNLSEHHEKILKYHESLNRRTKELIEYHNEIAKNPPYRVLAKQIEKQFINKQFQGHVSFPRCPCCDEPFHISEILNTGVWNPVIEQKIKKRTDIEF